MDVRDWAGGRHGFQRSKQEDREFEVILDCITQFRCSLGHMTLSERETGGERPPHRLGQANTSHF